MKMTLFSSRKAMEMTCLKKISKAVKMTLWENKFFFGDFKKKKKNTYMYFFLGGCSPIGNEVATDWLLRKKWDLGLGTTCHLGLEIDWLLTSWLKKLQA